MYLQMCLVLEIIPLSLLPESSVKLFGVCQECQVSNSLRLLFLQVCQHFKVFSSQYSIGPIALSMYM